jgi:hypothetical protein
VRVVMLCPFLFWAGRAPGGSNNRLAPPLCPRACYELRPRMPAACWRKRQANATKCSPVKVAGSLS